MVVTLRRMAACAGLLGALAATPISAQDYLGDFPTAATVQQQIREADPQRTLARQAAALERLKDMARATIGDPEALNKLERLSRADRDLLQGYLDAQREIFATPGIDRDELSELTERIDLSPGFADGVRAQFFSPAWLAAFAPKWAAYEQQLRELPPDAPSPLQPDLPLPRGDASPGLLDTIFGSAKTLGTIAIVVVGLLWLRRVIGSGQQKEVDRNSRKELARLGATEEARTKAIEATFDRKTDTLQMDFRGYFGWRKTISGEVVRSLAAMPSREREVLRALYHLHNIGSVTAWNFYYCRLTLLYGDGKGQVFKPFAESDEDFAVAFKKFTGATAESTVSTVLHYLADATAKRPNHPVIKALGDRLVGGGEVALSSSAAFAAAQTAGKPGLVLGTAEDSGELVTYTGEGSVISVAPPGAGKTQCHVFPTMLSWRGPAVVLDVKGEIYAGTSKWRSENVGPVFKFAPLDPANSASYNPLTAVRSDPDYLWEDSRFLADMMLVMNPEAKDPFWESRARDVLTAAIARACLTDDPARRSLGNVLDIFHGVGWDAFVRELQSRVDIRSMMRAGTSLGEMEKKTRDGVLQTGLASLSAWDGDRIERATRKSDWSPLDLRGGKSPTIYICLKPNEVESYISVLRVFIAQHIRALTSALPPQGAAPILFMLDELPRLRHMPPVEEALEIGRQYGIRLWMFTQSLGQLEAAYANHEGMVGSCAVRLFMNPSLHDGTAQKLSDDIGMQEGVLDNQRQKIVEAPVLAGPEYKESVIVMATGFKPFRLRKRFTYQDDALKARLGSL